MKHGTVYQRHVSSCPREADGTYRAHRCRGGWAYRIDLGRDGAGKRLQTARGGFPTKAAAKTALDEFAQVLLLGGQVHGMTVAEYLDAWLVGKNRLKPATRAQYEDFCRIYLKPGLGHIPLLELRAQHLDRFYATLAVGISGRPLSNGTRRRIHACLASALSTAVKRRLLPFNPAAQVELAPENPQRAKPWTTAHCQRFLLATLDDRLGAAFHLALLTGMRRGEVVGLRWENLDLDGGAVFVVEQVTAVHGKAMESTPKSRRSVRVIPLDQGTVRRLRRHGEVQQTERALWGPAWIDSGHVFTKENGERLRPEYLYRRFHKLAAAAGLPVIRLHDLRHTNASLSLEAGLPIKVVSERLGHATTAITADLYTHVSPTVGRQAAEQLAQILDLTPSLPESAGAAADQHDAGSEAEARTASPDTPGPDAYPMLTPEASEGPEGGSHAPTK